MTKLQCIDLWYKIAKKDTVINTANRGNQKYPRIKVMIVTATGRLIIYNYNFKKIACKLTLQTIFLSHDRQYRKYSKGDQ